MAPSFRKPLPGIRRPLAPADRYALCWAGESKDGKVSTAYFKEPRPTRPTVVVAKLVGEGHIEITVTARK
jgi:hypothetical protein